MNSSLEKKGQASLTGKPPIQNLQSHGIDHTALNAMTSKTAPSKWSVNIQEIVKRTQKNLERGSSSQKGGTISDRNYKVGETETHYMAKHTKMGAGFGSSSTKDKNSLLYNELKRKLQYDTSVPQCVAGGESISAGRKKEYPHGFTVGQHSSKIIRPSSLINNVAGQQIAAKNLYLANQKSAGATFNERIAIARLKRKNNEMTNESREYDQRAQSANDISVTTGSMQGTQGVVEIYGENNNPYGNVARSIEERAITHQRTLIEAGRLNVIGSDDADEEAQMLTTNKRPEFRRHNSNLNRPTLAIQDQEASDEDAIAEAGATEEQTYRDGNINTINGRIFDEPVILTTNNFMTEHLGGGALNIGHLKPTNSTLGTFTNTQGKRQTEIKGKTMQAANIEHRQKIFEEEIIKRIKEIQRYVKSLHLQVKKTQAGQDKLKEEVESDKDVLISLQKTIESYNKKQNADRLKSVSTAELENTLKQVEHSYNEKLLLVVQEATDQILKQVNNEIIPDARLKMYDSITEETKRLKIDTEYQLKALKREQNDLTKKDRLKNQELIEKEVQSLRSAVLAEQNTQTLQILAQVDAQISKALKESRQAELPRAEINKVRTEMLEAIRTSEQKSKSLLHEDVLSSHNRAIQETEQRLEELKSLITQQLESKLTLQASLFITPEVFNEKMQSLKQDVTKSSQSETRKAIENQKILFVSNETLQTELQKMKREVNKQGKTDIEEAKFDTIQMIQSDIVEVANQQKDTRFKLQEFSANLEEMRAQFEEAVKRLTNREKEQTALQITTNKLKEQQTDFQNKIKTLSVDIRELMQRERTPIKEPQILEKYDSHRDRAATIAIEELDALRNELQEINANCNSTQSLVEEIKMQVNNNKSSAEKQIKAIKTQIDEISKKLIDEQFEDGQNKQFLEDQFSELSQSLEGLQARIVQTEETQAKETESLKKEMQRLDQSSERQFQNLNNGVSLLEDWKARAKSEITSIQSSAAKTSSSEMKSFNSSLDSLSESVRLVEQQIKTLQTRLDTELASVNEVSGLKKTITNLSQSNINLENDIKELFKKSQTQQDVFDKMIDSNESHKKKIEQLQVEIEQVDRNFIKQKDLQGLHSKIETLQREMENKLESLQQTRVQQTAMTLSSQPASNQKWQESSVKKLDPKKASGWAELKMTRIEPNDQSMRSSNLEMQMVRAQGPQSALKEKPNLSEEGEHQAEDVPPFMRASVDENSKSLGLRTPEQTNSRQDQAIQGAVPAEKPNIEQKILQSLEKEGSYVKLESIYDDNCTESLSANNKFQLGKPTEYSASVDHQHTTQRDADRDAQAVKELEIKNPVQFEMIPESDLKVNETNSQQTNLLIQDRNVFEDYHNLNDQIISPSEGIQVGPDGNFYKLQREIRSNQVLKKNKMTLMHMDPEIESEKVVESASMLAGNDFQEIHFREEKKVHLAGNDTSSRLQLEEFQKVATSDQLDLVGDSQPKLNEQTQLFRTQKMSGLALLSQLATNQHLEDLDYADLENEQKSENETSKIYGFAEEEEEEEDVEGEIPINSKLLGMRLGEHIRNNSDGKSSFMGLLGLESHHESVNEVQPAITDSPQNMIEEIDCHSSNQEDFQDEDQNDQQEDDSDDAITAFIYSEIADALNIMYELSHPEIAKLMQE